MLLYVDGVAIGATKSATLNLNGATIDTTTKDSAGWGEVLPGKKDWSVDFDGLWDGALTWNAEDAFDTIKNGTLLTVKLSGAVSGDVYFEGSGYMTKLTVTAPVEDAVTISGSFVGTGALARHAVGGS